MPIRISKLTEESDPDRKGSTSIATPYDFIIVPGTEIRSIALKYVDIG